MIRAFVAIELPESLKNRLTELQRRLNRPEGVSWVKASNMHLTLRFLGDVAESQIEVVRGCMERAAQAYRPFELAPKGVGAFPNPRRPRVFWAGVEDATGSLAGLQKRLQAELEQKGFGQEDYPFRPHLTLGRVKDSGARVTALQRLEFSEPPFRVDEIALMRSDLRPQGSLYTRLAAVKLNG